MKTRFSCALVLAAAILFPASAATVYVTSSGNAPFDANLSAVLASFGHSVTVGDSYLDLDGTQPLNSYQVVYLQTNYNWSSGSGQTPGAGQTALVNYVNAGGGLITTEWLLWRIGTNPGSYFTTLNPILPAGPTSSYDSLPSVTFTEVTSDPVINQGLPNSFVMPLENIGGTRTHASARPGAATFYAMEGGFAGLVGWNVGGGRVLNFTTTNGLAQLNDADFQLLLSNTIEYAGGNGIGVVPEPATLGLMSAGVLALLLLRRRV